MALNQNKPRESERDTPFLLVVRIIFVVLVTYIIYEWAQFINPFLPEEDRSSYALLGCLIATVFVIFESQVRYFYPQSLFFGFFGLVCGLSASLLIQFALPENLPQMTKDLTRLCLHLFLGYFGVTTGLRYAKRIDFTVTKLVTRSEDHLYGCKIVDTSALIDGRIAEIAESGFLEGRIVIPVFVINELQILSDAENHLKRNKGRRGLDISKRLQHIVECEVELLEEDFPNLNDVDRKLIALAKKYEGALITLDYNLTKVAEIENIPVMNINQLSQALKTVLLPGEEIQVQVLREGKEPNQGVGYLEDGTMVVVESGKRLIGQNASVSVVSVLQTSAGRMIFTKPLELEYRERPKETTVS